LKLRTRDQYRMNKKCLRSRLSEKKRNWKNRIFGAERRVSEIANGIRVLGCRGRSFSATDVRLIQGDKKVSRNMITEENLVGGEDPNYREWDKRLAL